MSLQICLWFDGNGREAAEFYVRTFPDAALDDAWTTPAETPSNETGSEVVVNFTMWGQQFQALNGGPAFRFNESVSFRIPCETQDDIDHYWSVLSADGGVESQCGWLKDKFGLSWQITAPEMMRYLAGPNRAGASAATTAMMAMSKIELDVLRLAYEAAAGEPAPELK